MVWTYQALENRKSNAECNDKNYVERRRLKDRLRKGGNKTREEVLEKRGETFKENQNRTKDCKAKYQRSWINGLEQDFMSVKMMMVMINVLSKVDTWACAQKR